MQAVIDDAELDDSDHDMGGDVIPAFVERGEAFAYDMTDNAVPGATDNDRLYWRDVGSLDSFYEAHMDLIRNKPPFNLYNNQWPIYTQQWNTPPAKFTRGSGGQVGDVSESLVALGSLVEVGEGATVHRAILDKWVTVVPGATVGIDKQQDLSRGFTVTESGITVVAKGLVVA
jgi:glucose-1-phosphate adenylyltransferase